MKKFLPFLFLLLMTASLSLQAKKKTICLSMIVKDEKDVIEDCLNSVKPIIDSWVIFDTGSTDGTQEIIRKCMKEIPGELHESPWVNFGHNRNEALEVAKKKGDYILWLDADEIFSYSKDFELPDLTADSYRMIMNHGYAEIYRVALVNSKLNWKWIGVIHEALQSDQARTSALFKGVTNVPNPIHLGARSKTPHEEKYFKDALLLEEALKQEPENARYMYYLGASYAAAKREHDALVAFEKRLIMPSSDLEETYHTLYCAGVMCEKLERYDKASDYFIKAFQFRPNRAEPLVHAAAVQRKKGNLFLGYLIAKHAMTIPYPQGEGCVGHKAYDHEAQVEFANCSLLLGKWDEGLGASEYLLNNPNLPKEYLPSVKANIELAQKNLGLILPKAS